MLRVLAIRDYAGGPHRENACVGCSFLRKVDHCSNPEVCLLRPSQVYADPRMGERVQPGTELLEVRFDTPKR